jgi:ribonuclease HII
LLQQVNLQQKNLLLLAIKMMLQSYYQETYIEAGCDEAGRGCYAGPVYAAAVILPRGFFHPLLNDSKQVKPEERYELREIIQRESITWAVGFASEEEIDSINILQASWLAMHRAIEQLKVFPELLLIDGNRFKSYRNTPHQCIVKGDELYSSIAAASILAKTYRDDHMTSLHEKFPQYNWKQNKGYGTLEHRNAIDNFGLCEFHRRSFQILPLDQDQEIL